MEGKVWLVGAGPGDPGLLTIKGAQILAQADTVVYDALVGPGVLTMIAPETECINVGKRVANHTMAQEEINELLLRKAQEGKRVVRLKGGDPFLFGRGGEELELLSRHGIPFEVVPGITSAIAVPAYNGIPVTHRDFCSSVHLITGHKRRGAEYDIDFPALVKAGGTLVFLMGLGALEDICQNLLAAGMRPDMPAAVLSQGTGAAARRVTGPLKDLSALTRGANLQPPAIIVAGEVCTLADTFSWAEKKPLSGCSVLITRPRESISAMAAKLREKGAEVWEMPAIRTVSLPDSRCGFGQCLENIKEKGAYDWIIFTSPAGVRIFMEKLFEQQDIRILAGSKIAAIGSGTEKELKKYGLYTDFVPSVYDGETLGRELAAQLRPGMRIWIPRAAAGNAELTRQLQQVDAVKIDDTAIYETVYETTKVIDEKAAIEQGKIDYAVFTSASTVRGFAAAVPGLNFTMVKAVCIGEQTKAEADRLGMQTWMSEKAAMDSLVDKVIEIATAQKI